MAFILYRSSAGSGKTYTLVKEYLNLVLDNPERFKHILAITFTNKAAGEMKERILQALKQLAKRENLELENTLLKDNPGLRNIHITASSLLTQLLHEYSDFAVMTIDSFIHRVIKAFALEIGLPLNFKIALNYDAIQTFVTEQLLGNVGNDDNITTTILEYVRNKILAGKSWNIEPDIKSFEQQVMNEKNIDWVQAISGLDNDIFTHFLDELDHILDDYIKTLHQLAKQALELIASHKLETTHFAYGKSGAGCFLEKCATLTPAQLKEFKLNSYFEKEIWYAKKSGYINIIKSLLANGLSSLHHQIVSHINQFHAGALTAILIRDNFYLLAMVRYILSFTNDYKRRNNIIPISDFNVKVYEIVKYSPVPFIYAILGERFNHYLIDEFQDTSRMQWESLFPLIENALASNFFCMGVGDGKQSIYRWRGGDVEIMENDITERINEDQVCFKPLNKNFRSRKNIIDFNNRFFAAIRNSYHTDQDNLLLEGIYRDISQEAANKEDGYVSLQLIESLPENTDADELVLETVKTIVDNCTGKKNYKYNDIAVLVRENKHGQKVAEFLLENNIPVISPDSLLLPRVPLIRFLVDVLRYLDNPGNKIPSFSLIHYLSIGKKINPLDSANVAASFLEGSNWELSTEILEFFKRRAYLVRMPVYELVEEIIRIFNLGTLFDKKTAGYLQAFLDIVANYTEENSMDVCSFLDWWESQKDTEKERFALAIPGNKNAVRIMTIHKAKGLEFPVVIIPYANWEHKIDEQLWLISKPPLDTHPPLNFPVPVNTIKAMENSFFKEGLDEEKARVLVDNINMLYVALTRAIDNLYIIAYQRSSTNTKTREEKNNFYHFKNSAVPHMVKDGVQENHFTYGQPVHQGVEGDEKIKKPGRVVEVDFSSEERLLSNRWYSRITIRRKSDEFWRFLFPGIEGERYERRKWGILVHQVLEHIYTEKDIERAIEQQVIAGEIKPGEREILENHIRAIIKMPQASEWFNPAHRILTEWPIISDEGTLRPDRVIEWPDHVVVVDFKTGDRHKNHKRQMTIYKNSLKAMGYTDVRGFLFYLENKEVVAV